MVEVNMLVDVSVTVVELLEVDMLVDVLVEVVEVLLVCVEVTDVEVVDKE